MKSFLQAICMSQYYFQLYVYGIIVDLWHYNSLCILAPAPAPLVTWQMAENLRTSYQHRVRLDSPHTGNRVPSLQRVFSVSEWSYQKTSVESYFDLWLSSVISIRADWHHGNCVGGRRLARVTFSLKVLRISNYREWIWACLIPRPSLELSWLHMNSSIVSMQSTKWSVRWPGDEVSSASLFFCEQTGRIRLDQERIFMCSWLDTMTSFLCHEWNLLPSSWPWHAVCVACIVSAERSWQKASPELERTCLAHTERYHPASTSGCCVSVPEGSTILSYWWIENYKS